MRFDEAPLENSEMHIDNGADDSRDLSSSEADPFAKNHRLGSLQRFVRAD